MEKKRKKEKSNEDVNNSKLFAFLAVLLSIIGFIIALITKRDDKYVMFYAKQSLVLFIACVIVWAIQGITDWIPVLGMLIKIVLNVIIVFLWIFQIIYSLSGEEKETPIIGEYARGIKL